MDVDDTSDLVTATEVAEAAMPLVAHKSPPSGPGGEPLVLREGIPSRSIEIDRLTAFKESDDARQLLSAPNTVTYPVARSDEIVASITVSRDPARGWRFQSAGNVNRARSLLRLRDRDVSVSGGDPHDYYVVTVPVLGTTLLVRDTDEELQVAFVPGSAVGAEAERWRPAWEAFAELAEDLRRRRARGQGPPAPG